MTLSLSDLDGHSLTASIFKWDFWYNCACSSWQDFNWLRASRGPSAIAELLVNPDMRPANDLNTVHMYTNLGLYV